MLNVTTESGSTYLIDLENKLIKRSNKDGALRKDDTWIGFISISDISIGSELFIKLVPLAENVEATLRLASPVTHIEEIPDDEVS